jgi:hypothetical protein
MAKYGLDMDVSSVPVLAERHGLSLASRLPPEK